MNRLILAYCIENQYVAAKIAAALNGKMDVEKIAFDLNTGIEALKKAIVGNTTPVLLLMSDNFLKSERTMNEALATISALGTAQRLFTVTTDGIYQQDGHPNTVPTSFDRVSSVIQYMNFWQDRYLELRKTQPQGDENAWNERVKTVRTISSDVGELLRFLRSTEYFSFDQFEASNYIILYRLLNLPIAESMAKPAILEHTHTIVPEYVATANGSNGIHNPTYTEEVLTLEEDAPDADNLVETIELKPEEIAVPYARHEVDTVVENFVETIETPSEVVAHNDLDLSETLESAPIIAEAKADTADKPLTFEDLLANIRKDENYQINIESNGNGNGNGHGHDDTAEAVAPATSNDRPLTAFSIEEILKDEELQEIMRQKAQETSVVESVDSLFDEPFIDVAPAAKTDISAEVLKVENQIDLDDEENDLVNQIAAEVDDEVVPNILVTNGLAHQPIIEIPTPTAQNAPHTEGGIEEAILQKELLSELGLEEKTDAEMHDLAVDFINAEENDAEEVEENTTVVEEVSRIFEEADNTDDHFEFEDLETPLSTAAFIGLAAKTPKSDILSIPTPQVETPPMAEPALENTHPMRINRYEYAARLTQENRYPEALEQLEILLENDRTNIDAYVLMAYLAEQQGDFTLSLNSLEKVSLLNPEYPGIFYKLGRLTNEHFKKQNRKALRYYQDAVAQDPANADAQYRYAKMLVEQNGDFQQAIEHLKVATEHAPQHEQAAFELAKAYFEINDRANAAEWYNRATDLQPVFRTDSNDLLFHYQEPQLAPLSTPEPTINDNGITVLITGATSGIGRATAAIFAQNGYRVILTGRRLERLEEMKTTFETDYKNRVELLHFDVRERDSVQKALESLSGEWQNVDVLINNAGLASGLAPIHEGDMDDWDVMIDTNIKGLLYMTRAVAPHMVARRQGHIINVCSIAGKEIYPGGNVYNASKTAVDALTRAMRVDLYKYNIRVSQVAPGAVEETEFAKVRFHGDTEKAKIYEDFTPLKASDVADTIYYIVTRPDYVNIQDVVMMGTQQAGANWVDRSGRKDRLEIDAPSD
jgi:NADP-dependent 3-hydroxy acid dehydrogenase YdfG/thioredoxin-like negative regulator of GroEL